MNKPAKKIITFSALLFTGMHIINEYTDLSNTPIIPEKDEKTFLWKNMNITYIEKGNVQKPALLLIHNLDPSSSKEEWLYIDKQLSKDFHIFELDLPGCGKSAKPNIIYINYMYVELLNDFINKVIRKKTSICSTAYSSSFTFMLARIYPDIINKIIVINPISFQKLYTPATKKGKLAEKIFALPVIGTFLYNCNMSKSVITDNYKSKYFYNEKNISQQSIDLSYYNAHYNHSDGRYLLGSILGNYTNINIMHALPKIKHEIYLIGNENYQSIFQEYKNSNSLIHSIYVSHCRLLPQLEIPETIAHNICNIMTN